MEQWNSTVLAELVETVNKLEFESKDMQDVEFTVQDGKLYILQTRNAKRTAVAAVKIAVDLVADVLEALRDYLNSLQNFREPVVQVQQHLS